MYNDMMDTIGLVEKADPELAAAMNRELTRQRENIELIASENIVSPAVMAAMGSILTNKYAEGLPGKRYYGGCVYVDEVENIAIERACKLFGAKYANVQPHSGANANLAAFFALAHVSYVCWFLPRARRRLRAVSLAVTVPLLVFLFAAIVPEAPFPAERIGVAVYGLVIAAMLYSALQYDGACAAGFRCAALLFVFSDAVIAWNRFIGPVPARTWIVMTTYYLAQYLFFRFAFKTAARN